MRIRESVAVADDRGFDQPIDPWWPDPETDDADEIDDAEGGAEDADPRPRTRLSVRMAALLPVLPVLAAQAYLAWKLLWIDNAFLDEATYLYAGHQEVGHLAHGTPIATYQTFFSGAPVLYPVLAALVDATGGLTGARVLSMILMLLATLAVYLTGRRMYGTLAGFFAAALFAALGPTLHLSAFATFDALALCLLAWSTYCVVLFAHGDRRDVLVYGAALMILADCVKYASLLWNPFIILLGGLSGPGFAAWKCSRSWNLQRLGMVTGTLLLLAIIIGRQPYFDGFLSTTLTRSPSTTPAGAIGTGVAHWIGALLALATLGLLLIGFQAYRHRLSWAEAGTAAVLLAAGTAAPLNQLRIHTLTSLNKHVDFGALFAAVLAGAFLARVIGAMRLPRTLRALAAAAALAATVGPIGWFGVAQAKTMQDEWPNSTAMIAALEPLVHKGPDRYLVEDPYVAAYYIGSRVGWSQWADTWSTAFTDQATGRRLTGVPAFEAAIEAHHYAVIVLSFTDTATTDEQLAPLIGRSGYKLVAKIPHKDALGSGHYFIWTYTATP
ncbi:glycosyltransferase family 39 protein [Actinocrinis puniceicyclus]|uniref:Glycosyltransferase family 39 protein n=1 Tax=Actinocrinis puniceicyclus TaxID=977794 RepID=A0A8J7WQF5_9ACTN|nr:glycosyltransferase family 39 protein [Actinocrinis puniceicyclus]MBS2964482.1 glycosyltransferase family 39 protein [Actinocrinis puniceicyclus]